MIRYLHSWYVRRLALLLPAGSIRGRLAFGTFWAVTGSVLPRLLTLPASIICARLLGKSGFGEMAIIQSTVGMLGGLAGLGLGITGAKHVAEWRQEDPRRAGRILAISTVAAAIAGGVAALLLFFFAPVLAAKTIAAPNLAGPLACSAALLLFGALNGAQVGALSGFEAFKAMAVVNLWSGVCFFALVVLGVALAGLAGGIWGLVGAAAVECFLNNRALRRECARSGVPYSWSGCWSERRILWRFSLPSLLCGSIGGPAAWACNAMLVNQPSGYAELGVFNAANQWRMALLFIPSAVGQVVIPMLSYQLSVGNRRVAGRILKDAIAGNAIVMAPIVLVLGLLSPWIMSQYGKEFAGAAPVMWGVLATAALLSIQLPVGHVMTASGRMWTGFLMNSGWAIVLLGVTRSLLKHGALGLSLGYVIAYAVHGIWTFGYAYWLLRERLGETATHEPEVVSDSVA